MGKRVSFGDGLRHPQNLPLIPTFIHFLPLHLYSIPLQSIGQIFKKCFPIAKKPIFIGYFLNETFLVFSYPQA